MHPLDALLPYASNEQKRHFALRILQTTDNVKNAAKKMKGPYQEAKQAKDQADLKAQSDGKDADYLNAELGKLQTEPVPENVSQSSQVTYQKIVDILLDDVVKLEQATEALTANANCFKLSIGQFLGCGTPIVVEAFIQRYRQRIQELRRPSKDQVAANRAMDEWKPIVAELRRRGIELDAHGAPEVASARGNEVNGSTSQFAPAQGIHPDAVARQVAAPGVPLANQMDRQDATRVPSKLPALPPNSDEMLLNNEAEKRKHPEASDDEGPSGLSTPREPASESGSSSGSEHKWGDSSEEEHPARKRRRKGKKAGLELNLLIAQQVVSDDVLNKLVALGGKADNVHTGDCEKNGCQFAGYKSNPSLPPLGSVGLGSICTELNYHPTSDKEYLTCSLDHVQVEYDRVKGNKGQPQRGAPRLDCYVRQGHVKKAIQTVMLYKENEIAFPPFDRRLLMRHVGMEGRQEDDREVSPELPHADIALRPVPRAPAGASIRLAEEKVAEASRVSSSFFGSQEPEETSQERSWSQASILAAPPSQYRSGFSISPSAVLSVRI
jgi:hypothetical protein